MSNSKSRPGKGSRPLARSKAGAARRIRTGLLGSTALIAVGLAASPVMAQITVATPAGGGTITRTAGSNPTVDNQTGSGGGLLITNVTQSTDLALNNGQINNTTGAPGANALEIRGSTSGLNSTGLLVTGVNNLTATANGGAALYMSTNANMGLTFASSGSVFTGSYGLNLNAPGGYISLDSTGQSQSFVGNGTAVAGINAISAINAGIIIGGSSISGFATGVNAQNAFGTGFTSTGGSISATGTGIRLDATNGQNSVDSQSAITAQAGIHSTAAGNTAGTSTITTRGEGTLNSTAAGSGTGIVATSAGNLTINAGAAIGDVTRFGAGINATGTAGVNLTAAAAINATNGIFVSSAGPIVVTTSGDGTVDGAGTGISVSGTAAAATMNVSIGAAIGATTTPQYGVIVNSAGGRVTFSNTAVIRGTTAGLRLNWGPSFPATGAINVGADIIGGIDASTGMANVYTIAEGATVSGLITTSFGTGALITNNTGSSLVNFGTIISTGGGTNNSAVRHLSGGPTTNTATGVISGRTGIAGNGSNATPTTNAGSIIGTGTTSTEAGIVTAGGLITNTGSISGGYGGIRNVNNFLTLNNQAAGTVTGAVNGVSDETSTGRFTITNAGVIQTLGGTAGAGASGVLLNSVSTQTGTLTNSGTITGGSDATNGFGVNVADGALTLTNQAGGVIAGGTGGIRLASDDLATLNLNAGSTVTGSVISTNSGARTTVLAGLLTGAYDGSGGSGVDTFTLASTGSVTGAINLGGGADIFNWQGGTFTTVNAGSGADTFSSAFGVGNTRTLDQTTLSGFETYQHLSGTLVVDGSRTGGDGWSVTSGASIDLAGSLNALTGSGRGITVNGNTAGSSVNIRSGAVIDAYTGVWFNGAGVYTFTNAGRISTTGGAAFQSNGATTFTNTGSIADSQGYGAFFGTGLSTVTNSGVIAGGSDATFGLGIRGGSGGLTVNNAVSGIIAGGASGITGANGLTTINNVGRVGTGSVSGGVFTAGGTGIGVDVARAAITNSGTISGATRAISLSGAGLQNTIVNTGTIRGGQDDAIASSGNLNLVNGQAGVIQTDLYAGVAYLNNAGGTLTNAGSLIGGNAAGTAAGFQSNTTGAVTFNNYGSSTGTAGGILSLGAGSVISNLFAGSTTGNILLGGANDTLALYNGRGTAGAAVTDAGSGLTLQSAGTLAAATTGTIDLGGGNNTLILRGGGDGTAANGAAGSMVLGGIGGLSILTKADTGTWTVTGNGAGVSTINAGIGGGDNGLLILNGTGLTSAININGAAVRAMTAAALGTGAITMTNPTLQFAATDTYNNNILLAASSPTTDPTNLQTFGTGVTATLGGAITQAIAGQPLVFSSVDANGAASTGTFVLTNVGNSWTGLTTVSAGTTLSGAYNTISGGSITNDGRLVYTGGAGTVVQNITGSGTFTRNGAGALTLAGVNNWTGLTTIQGGELRGTAGSISGSSIVNNGVLTYINTTAGTASQVISGSGVIDIAGTAATTLNGTITTSGTLSISGTGSALVLGGTRIGGSGDSGYGSGVLANGTNAALTVNGAVNGGGFVGVRVTGQGASVSNFGTISNTGTAGIDQLGAGIAIYTVGGSNILNNGSALNTTAVITGRNNAINQRSSATAALTVNNYGLLAGAFYSAIEASGSAGALTVNNNGAASAIVGQGNSGGGSGIAANGVSALTVNNAGRIIGRSNGVSTNGVLTLTNSGTIGAGTLSSGTRGAYSISGQYGVFANAGGSITNQAGGVIRGGSLAGVYATGPTTLLNAGTITSNGVGGVDAVTIVGQASITNTGSIASAANGGSGIAVTGAGSTITNAGTITGSNNANYGYGVQNAAGSGVVTITNQAGGVIAGGMGSILLNGGGDTNIDLQAGSLTNGQILSYANGTHNLTVAGALNGAYNAASGLGVDHITLTAAGAMTSADLGAGADSFTWQGGVFTGGLEGGGDVDTFNTSLGGAGTLSLNGITGFEVFNHNAGNLTLTGSGAFNGGVSVNGGTLAVNGELQGDTLVASGATLTGSGLIDGVVTIGANGTLAGVQGSTLTLGSLVLDSSAITDAAFTRAGGPALFAVTNDLTLDGVLNVSHTGAFGFGVYGLMTYGGSLIDNGLTIATAPTDTQRILVQTSIAGEVNVVHAPSELLFWDGGNTGQHDNGAINGGTGTWTAAGSEWTDAGGLYNGAMEPQPGFAVFQGAGGVVTVDNVNGAVGVTGIQFASNGYNVQGDSITLAAPVTTIRVGNGTATGAGYVATIASELTGAGQLAVTDLGRLVLTGENTYTGDTTVNAGTLQVGDGAAGGSILGSVALTNGATLAFARNDGHVFSNAVSGAGTVRIDGVLTLTGPITASNGVNVSGGSNATLSNVTVMTGNAITAGLGSTVNIAAGSVVQSGGGNGVFFSGADGTFNNDGSIVAGGVASGVFSIGSLTATNGASGEITGVRAVTAVQNLSLVNAGVITGTATVVNSSAISSNGVGTVTNTGSIYSGTNALYTGGVGTLVNSGLIEGGGTASTVRLIGAGSTLTNLATGAIRTTGSGIGVYLDNANSVVTNSGSITGGNAVYLVGGGVLTNDGLLTGTGGSGVVSMGGSVFNLAGGSITGISNGINFNGGAGSVVNAGAIVGTNAHGVTLASGGTVENSGSINGAVVGVRSLGRLTLTSSGSISGGANAIESVGLFNDSLTFLAGSTTSGSILTDDGDDLISVAGALNGAVFAGAGADTVTLYDIGSFGAVLDGGDGVDVFVLDGSSVGQVSIGNVLNFESRVKQGSGAFILTGGDVSTAGWTINDGALLASGGASINDAVSVTIGVNGGLGLADSETIGSLNGAGFVDLGSKVLTLANGGAYDGVIEGSGAVVLNGGLLTLSGSNTWTGLMDVAGGVLTLGDSDVLSDQTVVRVATGATFDLGSFNDTVLELDLSGALLGTGTLTARQYQLHAATIDANLGAGMLYQIDGTSMLNGLSGASQVSVNSGALRLGAADRLSDAASVFINANATLDLQTFDDTVGYASISGALIGSGTLTAGTYVLNAATIDANLGAGSLYQNDGTSVLNGLSGASQVLVNDGVLRLGAADRLSDTASLFINANAALDLRTFDDTVGYATIVGALIGSGTLTADTYVLNGATIDANLGAGNLYQNDGTSVLNGLSGASQVSVSGGVLRLGAADRLSDTANLFINANATLDLQTFDDTVGYASIGGVLIGSGTLTADTYVLTDATIDANLGAGNLYQLDGTSVLNGLSGASEVSVSGGVLRLGAADRLSDTANLFIDANTALDLQTFNETVGYASIGGGLLGSGILTAGVYGLNGATIDANLGAGDLWQISGVSTLNGTSASNAVNVIGGTLAMGGADRFLDTSTIMVAAGAVLDLGAFNDSVRMVGLNGTLNGSGTLSATEIQLNGATVNANLAGDCLFNLAGVSVLNGTAAQTLVSVEGGTLRLGASDRLSDAATVSVSAGATLAIDSHMDRIGALFGMGDVTVGSGGRLTFGGAESGFGGRLSGAGALVHTGGLFTLMGDHTLGSIVNQGGELRFLGTTTGSATVTGGTMTGGGTIGGALTVSNGGVLSPGLTGVQNGIGGFTVGSLNLTGGRLDLDVTGASAGSLIDQIRVLGTAVLTGSTVNPAFQGPVADFDFSTRYLFLQAGNLVGRFSNGTAFTAANESGLYWRVRYDLVDNGAVMEMRQLTDFDPGQIGTANQRAVGAALNGGQLGASDDYAAVLSVFAGLNEDARLSAFASVSGEPLADITTTLFSASDSFMRTVQTSGAQGDDVGQSLSFASQLSLSTDRDGAANQLAGILGAFDPGASTTAQGGWVSVFAGDQSLEGTYGQANVDSRLNGFAGGYGMSQGAWTFGGAAGVSRVEGRVAARSGNYESDLTHAAGYVRYDDGQWIVDVTASAFGGEADTRRTVAVGAFRGLAIGNTHAEGQAVSASVSRRLHLEGDGVVALGVMGTASSASVDGFTETGAGALSLEASGLERDWQSLNVSARLTQPYELQGRSMRVYGGLGALLTVGDSQATGDMRFTGAPTGAGSFLVEGVEAPPLAAVADFGFEIEAAAGVTLSAGYRGVFSDRLTDNQIGMKMNLRW